MEQEDNGSQVLLYLLIAKPVSGMPVGGGEIHARGRRSEG